MNINRPQQAVSAVASYVKNETTAGHLITMVADKVSAASKPFVGGLSSIRGNVNGAGIKEAGKSAFGYVRNMVTPNNKMATTGVIQAALALHNLASAEGNAPAARLLSPAKAEDLGPPPDMPPPPPPGLSDSDFKHEYNLSQELVNSGNAEKSVIESFHFNDLSPLPGSVVLGSAGFKVSLPEGTTEEAQKAFARSALAERGKMDGVVIEVGGEHILFTRAGLKDDRNAMNFANKVVPDGYMSIVTLGEKAPPPAQTNAQLILANMRQAHMGPSTPLSSDQ